MRTGTSQSGSSRAELASEWPKLSGVEASSRSYHLHLDDQSLAS